MLVARFVQQCLGALKVGGGKPLDEPAQIPAKSGTSAMVAQVRFVHVD
jgi:hypothetical protein